jgi:hypothetical protein
VTIPPHSWLYGDDNTAANEEDKQEEEPEGDEHTIKPKPLLSEDIKISLTLNNQEWLDALSFHYHDIRLARCAYVHNYMEAATEEER